METGLKFNHYAHPSRMAVIEEESLLVSAFTSNRQDGSEDGVRQEGQRSIARVESLDRHNPTSLASESTPPPSIKMPRRHGKRRYGPGGQYVQPTTATKNVPKISKTKQRRREKIDNRVWRDQTPMPKRVKNTMSNEERSLATKARKAENKKTREEKEARKSKVMEDLKGMMAQTKTFQGAADGGLAALKNKVSKDMRGLM